jgi:hypothetical protein
MKNNNQTPVEWLIEEIENRDKIIDSETDNLVRGSMISYGYGDLYEQAKEMESKKQKKYDEMLEILKEILRVSDEGYVEDYKGGYHEWEKELREVTEKAKKIIKEATQI